MKKITLFLTIGLFLLSSCSSNISKQWSCRKVDSKLGCVSISEADHSYSMDLKDEEFKSKIIRGQGVYNSSEIGNNIYKNKHLVRTSDQVGRIWFTPYMDADNNYHEASFVRVVDENSRWAVREISDDFLTINKRTKKEVIDLDKPEVVDD